MIAFAVEVGLRVTDWPKVTAAFEHNEPFWTVDPDLVNTDKAHKEESTRFVSIRIVMVCVLGRVLNLKTTISESWRWDVPQLLVGVFQMKNRIQTV